MRITEFFKILVNARRREILREAIQMNKDSVDAQLHDMPQLTFDVSDEQQVEQLLERVSKQSLPTDSRLVTH
jgi:hypothetical protein